MELKLVVDHTKQEPEKTEQQDEILLPVGIIITGLVLVGIGLYAWINSEAFFRAGMERLK